MFVFSLVQYYTCVLRILNQGAAMSFQTAAIRSSEYGEPMSD